MADSTRADGVREARSLFQERGSGAVPTSALQLTLEVIDYPEARRLNRLWHSRLPRIGQPPHLALARKYLCFGAMFDGRWYGSAIWSKPSNRSLPQDWLELRRLAIASDAPKNTASRMLGVMTRIIRNLRPHVVNLVSYQDTEVHTGGIYKAAGWKPTVLTKFAPWDNKTRKRLSDQSRADKQRWELVIRPEAAGEADNQPHSGGP